MAGTCTWNFDSLPPMDCKHTRYKQLHSVTKTVKRKCFVGLDSERGAVASNTGAEETRGEQPGRSRSCSHSVFVFTAFLTELPFGPSAQELN